LDVVTLRGLLKVMAFLVVAFVALPSAAFYLISIPPAGAPRQIVFVSAEVLQEGKVRAKFTSDVDIRAYASRHAFTIDSVAGRCTNGEVDERERLITTAGVEDHAGHIMYLDRTDAADRHTSGPPDASGKFAYHAEFRMEEPWFGYESQSGQRDICLYIRSHVKLVGRDFRSNTIVIPKAAIAGIMARRPAPSP
jgi:hypothetical protein